MYDDMMIDDVMKIINEKDPARGQGSRNLNFLYTYIYSHVYI